MAVKIILKENVENLGHAGEIKQVAPGYYRNFLLPRGLAVEATKGQIRALESSASSHAQKQAKAKTQSNKLAQRIESAAITIQVRLGEQGRMYGSVTNKDIAETLLEQAGITVDRHDIELPDTLKSIGEHAVPIKLEHGLEANLRVTLIPEGDAAGSAS
jgi:large subunit ribosomal protein L9